MQTSLPGGRAPITVLASYIAFPYFDEEGSVAAVHALDALAKASAGQQRLSLAGSLAPSPGSCVLCLGAGTLHASHSD